MIYLPKCGKFAAKSHLSILQGLKFASADEVTNDQLSIHTEPFGHYLEYPNEASYASEAFRYFAHMCAGGLEAVRLCSASVPGH